MAFIKLEIQGQKIGYDNEPKSLSQVRVFEVGGRVRLECTACRKRIIADSQYLANETDPRKVSGYIKARVENHVHNCEYREELIYAKDIIPPQPEPQKRPYTRRFDME